MESMKKIDNGFVITTSKDILDSKYTKMVTKEIHYYSDIDDVIFKNENYQEYYNKFLDKYEEILRYALNLNKEEISELKKIPLYKFLDVYYEHGKVKEYVFDEEGYIYENIKKYYENNNYIFTLITNYNNLGNREADISFVLTYLK